MGRQSFCYHPVIGSLKMPNGRFRVSFVDGAFRYRTNAAGFRSDREYVPAKSPGTTRIAFFGDSFTEGAGVDEGQRYTDLLERSLDAEIYNFAMTGTGTDQQYLIYREVGRHYEHDLIVIGLWTENIRRNISRSRVHADQSGRHMLTPKPYFSLDGEGGLVLHNQPVPRPTRVEEVDDDQLAGIDPGSIGRRGLRGAIAGTLNRLGPGVKSVAQRVSRYQPLPEYDDPDGEPWRLTRAILGQWASEAHVPVVVVPIPVYQHVERTAAATAVRRRFAELHDPPNMIVHDPLDDFWRYSREDRKQFRFPHDHHLTESGHRALAQSLEPVLRELIRVEVLR